MNHIFLVVIAVILLVTTGGSSRVYGQTDAAAIPPEVKKTVAALLGHWVLTGTDTESGEAPMHFKLRMDCTSTALGKAVIAHFFGRLPDLGRFEASTVIGYSPEEQVVRWMEITSTGEYHDHRGRWHGEVIEFEPFKFTTSGKEATEYFSIGFPSTDTLSMKSVTETSEGKSIMECTGKRKSK
jgi:hypothetical protein